MYQSRNGMAGRCSFSDVEISAMPLKYELGIRHQKKLFHWRQILPADVVDFFIAILFQLLKL